MRARPKTQTAPRPRAHLPAAAFGLAWLAVCGPAAADAPDPDAYDPLLDRRPPAPTGRAAPNTTSGETGFFIGGGGFAYTGYVRSYLLKYDSRLRPGVFPGALITMGGRTRYPFEVGLDIGYGLGARWAPDIGDWIFAHDLLLEPRVLAHPFETERWDLVAGVAASNWMFDIGADGISQYLIGPFLVLGARRNLDRHSLLFAEVSGGLGKDTLAYVYEGPSEKALALDPDAKPHRIVGAWFPLVRISLGYRVSGF